ncbi:replication initiation protein [Clostridium perfringens]|nr:replication initiation protein [Clostridium perfringens]
MEHGTMKQGVLMQPNKLIKSEYNFTTIENRLFYKILYNVQRTCPKHHLIRTVLTVDELKTILKKNEDCTLDAITEKLEMFMTNILSFDYIEEETGKVKTFGGGLIASYEIDHKDQLFTISLHEIIHRHITDFIKMQKEGYSPINLDLLFKFKGIYTQRLYTLIRLWSRQNRKVNIKLHISTLRSYLKCGNRYPAYADFKKRIILPAIKELNAMGNMEIVFENKKDEIRKGRSVDAIVLHVTDHETRKYFNNDSEAFKPKAIKGEEVFNVEQEYIPSEKEEVFNPMDFYAPVEEAEDDEQPVTVDVPEEAIAESNRIRREGFKMFIKMNTALSDSVLDSFVNDFLSFSKDFMCEDSIYFKVLLEVQAKVMEKDNVTSIYSRQYKYFTTILMDSIVEYDLEQYLHHR